VLCRMLKDRGQTLDVALLIDVPSSYIKERMPGRRICKFCGASYHLQFNQPENEGICNHCGHDLVQRRDDHEEAVEERLKVYEEQTKPLIDYFTEKKLLVRIDGKREIEEVSREIIEKLSVIDNK
jgi:adenylate kinase